MSVLHKSQISFSLVPCHTSSKKKILCLISVIIPGSFASVYNDCLLHTFIQHNLHAVNIHFLFLTRLSFGCTRMVPGVFSLQISKGWMVVLHFLFFVIHILIPLYFSLVSYPWCGFSYRICRAFVQMYVFYICIHPVGVRLREFPRCYSFKEYLYQLAGCYFENPAYI